MPSADPRLAHALLETMWRIRAFEERVLELVSSRQMEGLIHLSIGQEAVAAGVCDVLRPEDVLFTGHRAHGHFVARGADLRRLMAELLGRASGLCGGKGGSMHLVQADLGLLGATGVVGGNVPLALGAAFAIQERSSDAVAVVFFGDGAAQAGHFLESLNLVSLWKLPVLLVCENNGYAEFTPRSVHTRVGRVADLATPYAITNRTVDGNNALEVRAAADDLLSQVRRGDGPALLECLTYRLGGHYVGDPSAYKLAAEIAEWQAKDPIRNLLAATDAEGWPSTEDARQAELRARAAVDDAVQFGMSSPWPDESALTQHVYA
jgi:acetoin:2,6-dichlorophenolindophenol oxidoreductase subunit alpha